MARGPWLETHSSTYLPRKCFAKTGPGEFPAQRPVTRSFDVYFDLRLNKRLSKQSSGWWLETLSWSLWRQCNVAKILGYPRIVAPVMTNFYAIHFMCDNGNPCDMPPFLQPWSNETPKVWLNIVYSLYKYRCRRSTVYVNTSQCVLPGTQ